MHRDPGDTRILPGLAPWLQQFADPSRGPAGTVAGHGHVVDLPPDLLGDGRRELVRRRRFEVEPPPGAMAIEAMSGGAATFARTPAYFLNCVLRWADSAQFCTHRRRGRSVRAEMSAG
jgi:hypothetical protein